MKNPLVVGYKGEIGRFILAGLLRTMPKALDIFCVDKNESIAEVRARIKKSDVIFLCVSLPETITWLEKFKVSLKGKVVIEQTSLKNWAWSGDLKKEFPGVTFIHMHVLFRPSETPDTSDRRVVIIDTFAKLANAEFYELYHELQEITESAIELCQSIPEHDKLMAVHQALTHRVLVRLAAEIEKLPHKTFISSKVVELANRIKRGGDLTRALQTNPDRHTVVADFKRDLTTEPLF